MKKFTFFLRGLSGILFDNLNTNIKYSKEEALKIVNGFSKPKNDFERAKNQYICTMQRNNYFIRIAVNLISFILIPIYLIFVKKNIKKIGKVEKKDAVFFSDRFSLELLPYCLIQEYKEIEIIKNGEKMSLDKETYSFIKKEIFSKYKYPYFLLKVIMKFSMISYVIQKYNPRAIISYTESSFVTSLLTMFCEKKNIKYICVMHGDRNYNTKLAFFRCSEYYVWDRDYMKIFKELGCETNSFKIAIPEVLELKDFNKFGEKKYDYTFYLQIETSKSLLKYKEIIKLLKNKGYKVSVRPHPLYENMIEKNLKEINIDIQYYKSLPLSQSLSITKNVVAKNSTVLYQAWYKGVNIVIDDITRPDIFEMLKKQEYIMLKKKHKLLSEVIK